jgi:pimeloyl-ACP methyl ester carboxylesterase
MPSAKDVEIVYVDVDGGRLYAEVAGSGADALLVHSGISDGRMWDDQFDELATNFRVSRYDMRGFGRSSAVVAEYSHTDDLSQVIEILRLTRPRVVAASMGARVVIDLALRTQGLFDRMLLVGPAISGLGFEDSALRACWGQMSEAWDAGDRERVIDIETRFWITGPGRPAGGADEAVIARVSEMQRRILELMPEDESDPEIEEDAAASRLHELAMPILVVVGEHDVSDIQRNANAIVNAAHDANLVLIPDSGHLPNMEAVNAFNLLALDFLA